MATLRKNILWMSAAEIAEFVRGCKLLKTSGEYDALVSTHAAQRGEVHGTPLFLPWHRAFLQEFEGRMRTVLNNPSFSVPYWDWVTDESYPVHRGPIWGPDLMGGAGSPITTGPFAPPNWKTTDPTGGGDPFFQGRLFRSLENNSGRVLDYPTHATMVTLLQSKAPSYDDFRYDLERGVHDTMHMWVGGQMSSVPLSVNDPVFWLHHANVDRIWYEYQLLYSEYTVPSFDYFNSTTSRVQLFETATQMPPTYNQSGVRTIGDAWDPRSSYEYDAYYWLTMSFANAPIGLASNGRAPAVVQHDDHLHAFYQDPGGTGIMQIWSRNGSQWDQATPFYIGQTTSDGPAAISFDNKIYIFYRDGAGTGVLWGESADTTTWKYNGHIGDTKCDGPPAVAALDDKLCVLFVDQGGYGVMYAVWDRTSWTWGFTGFTTGDSNDKFPPSIVRFQNKLHAFFKDKNGKAIMHIVSSDGVNWSAARNFSTGQTTSSAPCALNFNNELHLFYRDGASGADGILHAHAFDGETWAYDGYIGQNCGLIGSPNASLVGHRSICLLSTDGKNIYRSLYTWKP